MRILIIHSTIEILIKYINYFAGMNITPKRSEINMIKSSELMRWAVPKGLEGKVVSCVEILQSMLPVDPKFGNVFVDDREELVRYVRSMKSTGAKKSVAYMCPQCNKIVIGPPQMVVHDSGPSCAQTADLLKPRRSGRGTTGLDYMCSNCNAYLGSHPYSEHD